MSILYILINPTCPSIASKRSPPLESDTVFSSSKRAALLRREVINRTNNRVDDVQEWLVSLPDDETMHNTDAPDNDCEADDIGYIWEDTSALPSTPNTTVEPWLYSDDQKWTVALLKLLDDMNAPDYAFASVLRWARGANAARYSFYPDGGLLGSQSIDQLFSVIKNAKQLLPWVIKVTVPHGIPRDEVVFDFVPQLLHLLQNPKLMTADNLLIDPKNPLLPYASPNGEIGDSLLGHVYRDAYKRMISKPEHQLFVPIIQWIDRTTVTGNDRFS